MPDTPMQDAPKTEAQAAVAALIDLYGEPQSRDEWASMCAVAYTSGARVAATAAVAAFDRELSKLKSA